MKKIIFVTGTRADYGKIKSILKYAQKLKSYKVFVFVTGMHNIKLFGNTRDEISKDKIKNVYSFNNQVSKYMEIILSKTIEGFSNFIRKVKPDLIVVHGDRIETLACAIAGNLNLIKVAHIEGGELTGTIDEIIRHSVSKLSPIHFVTNLRAKKRLIQMGEGSKKIFVIGSPDIDILLKKQLPTIEQVKSRYEIQFSEYAICIFHPVVTNQRDIFKNTKVLINSIIKSKRNYVIIYPNNDLGYEIILKQILKLKNIKNIRILPSMRFEYYLTLLKNAYFIIGNSSSGIVEAPYYGVPCLNLGDRQLRRADLKSIINIEFNEKKISKKIDIYFKKKKRFSRKFYFGKGNSDKKFIEALKKKNFWNISNQKIFIEYK
jgi:UDP-N-acetylglucosamine 2-epimerase (hydrolysing)